MPYLRVLLSKLLRVLTRRYTDDLLEVLAQMALAAEPDFSCNFRQGFAGLNQPLNLANPDTCEIGVRRPTYLRRTHHFQGAEIKLAFASAEWPSKLNPQEDSMVFSNA